MNGDSTPRLQIGPVPPQQCPLALRLVLGRLPDAERQRQVELLLGVGPQGGPAEAGCQGLYGAYRGPRLVGAAMGQIQPGRTATVWPPRTVADEPPSTAVSLLGEVSRFLGGRDVRLAQTLLETDTQADETILREGGFNRLSELLYLVSPNSEFPSSPPATSLEFEGYSPANHQRLAAIVAATYQETLDCPQLNGIRDIEDVLAGYRAAGAFDGSRWLIVRRQGADVGCLLLNDFPQHDNWELVYMGVMPQWRGHGWGLEMVRYAQWRAGQAGRARLVLAVDAANGPAIRLYAAAGFQAWDRRTVYARIFGRVD